MECNQETFIIPRREAAELQQIVCFLLNPESPLISLRQSAAGGGEDLVFEDGRCQMFMYISRPSVYVFCMYTTHTHIYLSDPRILTAYYFTLYILPTLEALHMC